MPASPLQSHRSSVVSIRSITSLPEGTTVTFHPSSSSGYSSPLKEGAVRKARVSFPSSEVGETSRSGILESHDDRALNRRLAGGRTLSTPTTPSKSALKPTRSPLRELRTAAEEHNRARRRDHVVREIVVSEEAFKRGLDVIEEVFMNPLSLAASSQNPPLSSEEVRKTFADITDLSRLSDDLLKALRNDAEAANSLVSSPESPPRSARQTRHYIVPVLSTHLPFLAMYSTFITSFPATSTFLRSKRQSSESFRKILAEAESNPRAAKLHLEDWLLIIVQRVPRWILLLRDLLSVTDVDSAEHTQLKQLVLKVDHIAHSLNQRFHEQTATQELLALQRSFVNLPDPLIKPGRKLLKHGDLQKVGRRGAEARKFWLFTDVLLIGSDNSFLPTSEPWKKITSSGWRSQSDPVPTRSSLQEVSDSSSRRASFSKAQELVPESDRLYKFQQKLDLEDITVTKLSNDRAGSIRNRSFQILSPVESFEVIAPTENVKNEWLEAIRSAKEELLSDLRTLNTSAEHTLRKHRRRSLHAAPSLPDVFEQSTTQSSSRCVTRGRSSSVSSYLQPDATVSAAARNDTGLMEAALPAVEHENFVAAVWLPDDSTQKCMRCGAGFTVWRRRHHCRLCGVVCCHLCTTRSCIINDSHNPSTATSLVRTCDTCFDSIFNPCPRNSMASEGFRTVIRNLDYATVKNMPPSRPMSSASVASSQDGSVDSTAGALSTFEKGDALSKILHPTRTVTFEAVDPCAVDDDGRGDSPPRFARRVLESLVEQAPSPASSEEPAVEISKGKAVELLQCIVRSFSSKT